MEFLKALVCDEGLRWMDASREVFQLKLKLSFLFSLSLQAVNTRQTDRKTLFGKMGEQIDGDV